MFKFPYEFIDGWYFRGIELAEFFQLTLSKLAKIKLQPPTPNLDAHGGTWIWLKMLNSNIVVLEMCSSVTQLVYIIVYIV